MKLKHLSKFEFGKNIVVLERLTNKADGTPRFRATIIFNDEGICGTWQIDFLGCYMCEQGEAKRALGLVEGELLK